MKNAASKINMFLTVFLHAEFNLLMLATLAIIITLKFAFEWTLFSCQTIKWTFIHFRYFSIMQFTIRFLPSQFIFIFIVLHNKLFYKKKAWVNSYFVRRVSANTLEYGTNYQYCERLFFAQESQPCGNDAQNQFVLHFVSWWGPYQ